MTNLASFQNAVSMKLENHKKLFESNLELLRKKSGYGQAIILKPGTDYIRVPGGAPEVPMLVGLGLSTEKARIVRHQMMTNDSSESFVLLLVDEGCFTLFKARRTPQNGKAHDYFILADTKTDH